MFVIFFPSLIVVLSFRRLQYLIWMLVYIFALPIWNFVLPVYAFWHFDDFSWGATRQVTGAGADKGHGDSSGTFDGSKVSLKRWEEYEKAWRRAKKRGQSFYDRERNTPSPALTDSSGAELLRRDSESYFGGYGYSGSVSSESITPPIYGGGGGGGGYMQGAGAGGFRTQYGTGREESGYNRVQYGEEFQRVEF